MSEIDAGEYHREKQEAAARWLAEPGAGAAWDAARAAGAASQERRAAAVSQLVQTVEYVVIDGDPVSHWNPTTDDSGLQVPVLRDAYEVLPARYRSELLGLVETAPDEVSCWRCGSSVGYITSSRFDAQGRDVDCTEWAYTVLVTAPGSDVVAVQCEACAPEVEVQP